MKKEPLREKSVPETVMGLVAGEDVGIEERYILPFKVVSRGGSEVYEASIPSRAIVWTDGTDGPKGMERAIGAMLYGVAKLAREGSLDPDAPDRKGAPPIQHVMAILSERLAWHIERRREYGEMLMTDPGVHRAIDSKGPVAPEDLGASSQVTRHSEIIAALGTAVSALARIKDL